VVSVSDHWLEENSHTASKSKGSACAQDGDHHRCIQPSFAIGGRRLAYCQEEWILSKRIGVIGIVIDEPSTVVEKVNAAISAYSHIVIGRMGIPRPDVSAAVIALIIDGTTDEVGALTGKLGNIPGVTVKSALTTKTIGGE
jgi:putative iron-only hydrogenase system regulator